ncbi:hypothetical protein EDD37DRAFT_263352 [Exophiala viscosa]|uniref:uncharacterized protein n=1 Tax=Exophiala viscosa TaxID=2486360 RepID=UPI002194A34C|nr:hypothetical protein EDD37DRAFT_263352 [Exophiala viscosa]
MLLAEGREAATFKPAASVSPPDRGVVFTLLVMLRAGDADIHLLTAVGLAGTCTFHLLRRPAERNQCIQRTTNGIMSDYPDLDELFRVQWSSQRSSQHNSHFIGTAISDGEATRISPSSTYHQVEKNSASAELMSTFKPGEVFISGREGLGSTGVLLGRTEPFRVHH